MLPSILLSSLQTNKDKILAKRINVGIEHIKHCMSQDSILKREKEK